MSKHTVIARFEVEAEDTSDAIAKVMALVMPVFVFQVDGIDLKCVEIDPGTRRPDLSWQDGQTDD